MRKKTRDEDLAKRAKKLLREWQKLIDPQQPEELPKELSSTLNSVVGSSWSQSSPISRVAQMATNNDKKAVLQNIHSLRDGKFCPMKHSGKQKVEKTLPRLKGIKAASESSGGPEALQMHTSATKPHFSSEHNKEPTPCKILRKSVLQQRGQRDISPVDKVKHKAHSQYTSPSIQGMYTECHQSKDLSHPENDSDLNSEKMLEQMNNLPNKSKELARLQPGFLSKVTNMETEKEIKPSDGKRRKPQLKDYTVSTEGRSSDDTRKPPQLKNRKLTFDPLTQQIRLPAVNQAEEQHNPVADANEPVNLEQSPASSPSALHKMNLKDMSQNEIVKHYLNLQNNLIKTYRSQDPKEHSFMTEYMKCEEDNMREASKTYVQVPNVLETNLPGIHRDITTDDLHKINNKHWPGVNGCYDGKGHWYDWTKCISLDTFGDGRRLNILPYVCID